MLEFPLESFLGITTGFLGFFVIYQMLFSYKSNKVVNIYLVFIFLFASIRLIDMGYFEYYGSHIFNNGYRWLKPIFLFGFPIFYLYFKTLINDLKHFNRNDLLHFIIPALSIVFKLIQLKFTSLQTDSINYVQQIIVFLLFFLYLMKALVLVYKKIWLKKESFGTSIVHNTLITNWILFFLTIGVLLSLRLAFSMRLEFDETGVVSGYSHLIYTSVLWLLIFGKIISSPEILYGYPMLEKRISHYKIEKKPINSIWITSDPEISNLQDTILQRSIDEKIEPYLNDIDGLTLGNYPFRDLKYSIKELSKDLKIPTSHLSYIFKYHCKISFVEFKNYVKINDAIALINDGYLDTKTFEALSMKIGFNSYNSFYKSFKKYTNCAPKDYLSNKARTSSTNVLKPIK